MTTSVKEIWKDVVGYEGLYEVSSMGAIRRLCTNKTRMLTPSLDTNGYPIIKLCKDGKQRTTKVHRIVAMAFIPNPENKPCIDHINTIKTHNQVSNLRWCTHKENSHNLLTMEHQSNGLKGHIVSKETREKISNTLKGHIGWFKGRTHSDEAKEKVRLALRGRKLSEERKRKLSKPVCQYTIDGDFVAEYYGATDASVHTNALQSKISMCCLGKRRTAGGYIWKYKNEQL